jgi:subtilisin family serine protease
VKFNIQAFAKLSTFFVAFSVFVACGQSSGGGSKVSPSSCAKGQSESTGIQQIFVSAFSQNQRAHLMAEINVEKDFESFRHDIVSADSEASIKIISENLISIEMGANSNAAPILQRAVGEGILRHIEADAETFLIRPDQSPDEESAEAVEDSRSAIANASAPMEPVARSGKPIIVAIIDSGVDYTHPDLAPYMWHNPGEIPNNGIDDDHNGFIDDIYGWDFVNEDNDPISDDAPSYHGTHVAGIVKQAAMLAEQGINVQIMALKYLDTTATGRTSNAIRAIDYAIKNGAIVLNNSWGSTSYSSPLLAAIERTRKAGALFIAAAGNGDAYGNAINLDRTAFYPAVYPVNNIVSVAAADSNGILAPWSNYGAVNVDLAAPGVGIRSTRNGNTYGVLSGTSMAAPFVSGVAAMLWSLRPDLSYVEVRRILFNSVSRGYTLSGKMSTNGEINRNQANQAAASYVHNPNDFGSPELSPDDLCSP